MESPESFRSRFERTLIVWHTRLGAYCLGLDEFVPITLVACLDDGEEFTEIEQATGIGFLSLERLTGRRDEIDERGIDGLIPAVAPALLASLERAPLDRWIALSPYGCEALSKFATANGIPCRAIDWESFIRLSRKRNLLEGVAEIGLPRLPGQWVSMRSARYAELSAALGRRFVAQLDDIGGAGAGTMFIESEDDFTKAASQFADGDVWVAPYSGPLSLNVNAIATELGIAVGYPSVQITDHESLNCAGGKHCGNDFSAAAELDPSLLHNVREQTTRIGLWMASHGYRGLFGVDFVVDERSGTLYAVDVNPRWQGSTTLQTQAERRQGRLPLAAVEAAYRIGVMEAREVMSLAPEFFAPLHGSQLFPKNPAGTWTARGRLRAGIYNRAFEYVAPGLRLGACDSQGEGVVLVSGGIPSRGVKIAGGVTLLRVASCGPAVDGRRGRALPWVEDIMRGVYRELALEKVG